MKYFVGLIVLVLLFALFREYVDTADGACFTLDWYGFEDYNDNDTSDKATAVVLILPGATGLKLVVL